MTSLLTECFQQQLGAGSVRCQSWAYSWMDAHVCQHADQLHQHVLVLLHARCGRGRLPVTSALVAVVQPQERVRAALAPKELLPSLVEFGGEVHEGEKESHDKVL